MDKGLGPEEVSWGASWGVRWLTVAVKGAVVGASVARMWLVADAQVAVMGEKW